MSSPDVDRVRLLAEADLLFAFARLLAPPGGRLADEVAELAASGPDLAQHAEIEGLRPFATCHAALAGLDLAALAEEHVRLFDGALACPPNETTYVRRDKGAILGDIAGFYRAFAFEPRSERGEKVDHVATELEFLALLLVMQAEAPDAEKAAVTAEAVASFTLDHPGAFLPAFCRGLAAVARDPFHVALAAGLGAFWSEFAGRRGVDVVGGDVPSAIADAESATFECGPCG